VTAVKEWACTAVVRDGHPRMADNPSAAAWFPSLGYEVYLIGTRAYR
jgi:hypothetical protein